MHNVIQSLVSWVTNGIGTHGALAVFGLMIVESSGIPIPSEAISPFAGYLVSTAHMGFVIAVAAGVGGNLVGSWIAYFIGLWGGRELALRYGRYVGVSQTRLVRTERWFARYGEVTVLVSRLLPAVRSYSSFPAGFARMNLLKFTLYTIAGCVPWVLVLTYAGYLLGKHWDNVSSVLRPLEYVVVLAFVVGILYLIVRRVRSRPTRSEG